MIVCLCTGITDRRGRELVRQGATSLYEVGLTCSAGTCCGGCRETLVQICNQQVVYAQRRSRQIHISFSNQPGRPFRRPPYLMA